jgi:hypothetical protein
MNKHIDWGNSNETIYGGGYLLGKDTYVDGKHRILNVTFFDYMKELGIVDHTGPVHNFAVVWHVEDEDQYITQIYDHDTGEVYWEDTGEYVYSKGSSHPWSDDDDEITNALLMYGNLEQTIDGGY